MSDQLPPEFPKRLKIQSKAHRYRIVVTVETDTAINRMLDHIKVDVPPDATISKMLVPIEGETISHMFPKLALGAAENPFSVVADITEA